MRQLKFRAWDKVKKEWLFGYELLGGFSLVGEIVMMGELSSIPLQELNNIEIMQFIGLLDKNGVEIYEGDVYIALNNKKRVVEMPDIYYDEAEGYFSYKTIEIIGNIYQNPELLK